MNGWEVNWSFTWRLRHRDCSSRKIHERVKDSEKVKVLLAQALFGSPDILLLDELLTTLTLRIAWLENFIKISRILLLLYLTTGTLLVCTHMVDIDFLK